MFTRFFRVAVGLSCLSSSMVGGGKGCVVGVLGLLEPWDNKMEVFGSDGLRRRRRISGISAE